MPFDEVSRYSKGKVQPLFGIDERGALVFTGSGILLSVGEGRFLVSAAHVFDDLSTGCFLLDGAESHLPLTGEFACTAMPPSSNRDGDSFDVGVLRLDHRSSASLPEDLFLQCADLRVDGVHETEGPFCLTGFPKRYQKPRPGTRRFKTAPVSYGSFGADFDTYIAYQKRGIARASHLLLRFDPRRVSCRSRFEDGPGLHGMSGGGVWQVDGSGAISRGTPKLVAMFIEYRPSVAAALLTLRIGVVLALIAARYSELHALLPLSHELSVDVRVHVASDIHRAG